MGNILTIEYSKASYNIRFPDGKKRITQTRVRYLRDSVFFPLGKRWEHAQIAAQIRKYAHLLL
jgi:hypothetical protein